MNRRLACAAALLALLVLPAAAQAKKPNGGTVWPGQIEALQPGECGYNVATFNRRLGDMGYVANRGRCFKGRTERGVLAYRKVNGMSRNTHAGRRVVERVFGGRGGYRVRHPEAGEHAEVPLDKQVLVLAKGSRPFAIYPVSTGKPSTPTVTGQYSFSGANRATTSRACTTPSTSQRLRGPRLRRSPRLRRQPRLRPHLHRRPAADLRTAQVRRADIRLLRRKAFA